MNRPCAEAGCPEFAVYKGRCPEHASGYTRNRAQDKRVYNSKRWRILRRRKLGLNPICERCDRVLATDVHHRHGVAADPWSLAGLEALCHECHSRVTRAEQLAAA